MSNLGEIIKEGLENLSKRYKEILEERYGLKDGRCLSLEAIGRKRNVTRERIRQIINLAFKKIKFPEEKRKKKKIF